MVKASSNRMEPRQIEPYSSPSSSDKKYKGVRKRKWGKYVSEIRLPNCRERIWLGSYDTAEKAARAFDAALYCLRGGGARFNFPDDPPRIENGRSMSPPEIQDAAARFANAVGGGGVGDHPVRVDNVNSSSDTTSGASDLLLHHTDSPCCASVSSSVQQLDFEIPDIPLDHWFLDQFLTLGMGDNNVTDLGLFPEFNEYNNWREGHFEEPNTVAEGAGSFLWNF